MLLYSSYHEIGRGMATTLHFTHPVAVMLILVIFLYRFHIWIYLIG